MTKKNFTAIALTSAFAGFLLGQVFGVHRYETTVSHGVFVTDKLFGRVWRFSAEQGWLLLGANTPKERDSGSIPTWEETEPLPEDQAAKDKNIGFVPVENTTKETEEEFIKRIGAVPVDAKSRTVDVRGVGLVEFPAQMTDDEILTAVDKNFPNLPQVSEGTNILRRMGQIRR